MQITSINQQQRYKPAFGTVFSNIKLPRNNEGYRLLEALKGNSRKILKTPDNVTHIISLPKVTLDISDNCVSYRYTCKESDQKEIGVSKMLEMLLRQFGLDTKVKRIPNEESDKISDAKIAQHIWSLSG